MVRLVQIATSVVLPNSGLLVNRKKKIMGKQPNVAASTVDSKESCENFWISGKTETNMLSLSFFFWSVYVLEKSYIYIWSEST